MPLTANVARAQGRFAAKTIYEREGQAGVGNRATAGCYGTATHYRPDEGKRLTYFVGSYDFALTRGSEGWKIDSFRFNNKYVE
jgi:hypothetical protein